MLYDLVTGHPDRTARELVFLADLSIELSAWPQQTWTAVGVGPEAVLLAVVDRRRASQLKGLELGGVSAEEASVLGHPPMGYVREQLRGRLAVRSAAGTCAGCIRPAVAGQARASCRRWSPDSRSHDHATGPIRFCWSHDQPVGTAGTTRKRP